MFTHHYYCSYLIKCRHSPSIALVDQVPVLPSICDSKRIFHHRVSPCRRLEHWMVPKHLTFFSVDRAIPDLIQSTDCWGGPWKRKGEYLIKVTYCYYWTMTTSHDISKVLSSVSVLSFKSTKRIIQWKALSPNYHPAVRILTKGNYRKLIDFDILAILGLISWIKYLTVNCSNSFLDNPFNNNKPCASGFALVRVPWQTYFAINLQSRKHRSEDLLVWRQR